MESTPVLYRANNENLDDLVGGLAIRPDDVILAICGSGDQAFALLEHAKTVVAVDINPIQLGFARQRCEALRQGNYKAFLDAAFTAGLAESSKPFRVCSDYADRDAYFQKPGRMKAIRKKLSELEICGPADIVRFALQNANRGFTKVYLSNAYDESTEALSRALQSIQTVLPAGSLIYVARTLLSPFGLPNRLILDAQLTPACGPNRHEWQPQVYRKV